MALKIQFLCLIDLSLDLYKVVFKALISLSKLI